MCGTAARNDLMLVSTVLQHLSDGGGVLANPELVEACA